MSTQIAKLGQVYTISIPNAGTDSDIIDLLNRTSRGVYCVLIQCPATLTGTVKVSASLDGSTYQTLQQPAGTDVALAAGKVVAITGLGPCYFKAVSNGAEGAQRDFKVTVVTYNSQF